MLGQSGNRFNNKAITFHFLVSVNTTSCEIISENCLISYKIEVNRISNVSIHLFVGLIHHKQDQNTKSKEWYKKHIYAYKLHRKTVTFI